MNLFVVSVRGERLNASYSVDNVTQAIAKAEALVHLGTVVIVDPHSGEFTPNQFDLLRVRWSRPT